MARTFMQLFLGGFQNTGFMTSHTTRFPVKVLPLAAFIWLRIYNYSSAILCNICLSYLCKLEVAPLAGHSFFQRSTPQGTKPKLHTRPGQVVASRFLPMHQSSSKLTFCFLPTRESLFTIFTCTFPNLAERGVWGSRHTSSHFYPLERHTNRQLEKREPGESALTQEAFFNRNSHMENMLDFFCLTTVLPHFHTFSAFPTLVAEAQFFCIQRTPPAADWLVHLTE